MWIVEAYAAGEQESPLVIVDQTLVLEQVYAEQEGEEEFVFFEEGAANVAVQGVGKVFFEVLQAFFEVLALFRVV